MYKEQAKKFAKKVYEERKKKLEKESEIFQHVMNIMEMFSYSTTEETMIREIDLVPKVENKRFLEISVKGEDGDFLENKEIPKKIKEAIGETKIPKESIRLFYYRCGTRSGTNISKKRHNNL